MNKKKLAGLIMTGALTAGIIGGAGVSTFAATESGSGQDANQAENARASLTSKQKAEADKILSSLKADLGKLGVGLPEKGKKFGGHNGGPFASLSEANKEKAHTIMDQLRDGRITKAAAKEQLQKLGADLPERGKGFGGRGGGPFASLSEANKEKARDIMEQLKAGKITEAAAKEKLQKLGADLPEGKRFGGPDGGPFASLSETNKEKARDIMKQLKDGKITEAAAKEKLQKLGADLPEGKRFGGPFASLSEENKEKARDIIKQLKDGKITEAVAKEKLQKLGADLPQKGKGLEKALNGLDADTKKKAQALIDKAEKQLAEMGIDHIPFKEFKKAE
ncbi:hypothetical protein V1498_19795 [Peribacillus sp. SCS-26]|uniref:hypothetical protein n=1 Tax=Paraperibacillus marinus TaxID=3115295 RepID=UPI00390618D7